jgi:hypothetical protein
MDNGSRDDKGLERLPRKCDSSDTGRLATQNPVTLLPIAEKPFILGGAAATSVWSAALNISRSLYS